MVQFIEKNFCGGNISCGGKFCGGKFCGGGAIHRKNLSWWKHYCGEKLMVNFVVVNLWW